MHGAHRRPLKRKPSRADKTCAASLETGPPSFSDKHTGPAEFLFSASFFELSRYPDLPMASPLHNPFTAFEMGPPEKIQ
jgi:hypothetical protein